MCVHVRVILEECRWNRDAIQPPRHHGRVRIRVLGDRAPLAITRRCRPESDAFEQLTPAVVQPSVLFARQEQSYPTNRRGQLPTPEFSRIPGGRAGLPPDRSSQLLETYMVPSQVLCLESAAWEGR